MTDNTDAHDRAPDEWWRTGVIYQVYPRSFADGNGDGTGDLAGLRAKLPYLAELGVDAIWSNPWYPSPLNDGGYDVADYRDIHPDFGTLEEAEALIAEAHQLGIKVIADLVPNHTSSEHAWFHEALAAAPGSAARARYHFQPGKGDDGELPPSNWKSVFGGPAWSRVEDGEWYLHLFDPTQPDLNWDNPEVRSEFCDVLRFWLDRGIDGFRIDVSHGLVKDATYPDVAEDTVELLVTNEGDHPHWDRDGVHEINREWRAVLDEYDSRMMVAEAWVPPESLPLYLRPDEYHQSFSFDLLDFDWTVDGLTNPIKRALGSSTASGATTTWVLSNHDVMRHTSRLGLPDGTDWRRWPIDGPHDIMDIDRGRRRARAAALITLGLPGAAYVYQGDELGLPEVWDLPEDALDDPVWTRSGGKVKGRDGCRVPMPWEADADWFGFGSGGSWLPQPNWFAGYAADAQAAASDSSLELYRRALAVRRQVMVHDEAVTFVDLGPDLLAFERGNGVRCVVNLGSDLAELPAGDVLVASLPVTDGMLPPDGAVWLSPPAS